jgi:DNA-binding NarL/FixJ family response regulator
VLVVADDSESPAVVRGLIRGAHGWVTKDGPYDDLLTAIEAVRDGRLHLPAAAWGPVVQELLHQRSARTAQQDFISPLTQRQREILTYLVAGLTRTEIAAQLGVSPHTVRTHVRDMFRVVGVHSTPHLVAQARSAGVQGTPRRR